MRRETKRTGDLHVSHRHASCLGCGNDFKYSIFETEDKAGLRPECPNCGAQGGGKVSGHKNPAEYVRVFEAFAGYLHYGYTDWIAGEATLRFTYPNKTYHLYTVEDIKPFKVVRCRDSDGERCGIFRPSEYIRSMRRGIGVKTLSVDRVPGKRV